MVNGEKAGMETVAEAGEGSWGVRCGLKKGKAFENAGEGTAETAGEGAAEGVTNLGFLAARKNSRVLFFSPGKLFISLRILRFTKNYSEFASWGAPPGTEDFSPGYFCFCHPGTFFFLYF